MLRFSARKRLGEFALDLDIECRSRVTGVFGPSGCGKTTLLNCLAGVTAPDEGRIHLGETTWFDSDSGSAVSARRRRAGYVFQDGLLFGHMSVFKNITYGWKPGAGGPGLDEVVAVMELERLLDRKPLELSGGEQRRVAIARALLSNPALLLFDEPLTGLDVHLAGRVIVYLKRAMDAFDIPAVYVSHSISDIVYLCDDAIVLNAGKVIAQGSPFAVVSRRGILDDQHLTDLENVFVARLVTTDAREQSMRCQLAEQVLTVYGPAQAGRGELTLAVRACDIVLATERPRLISARNALRGTVEKVEPVGAKWLVFVDVGVRWMVEVGRAAVEELNLRPGAEVFAIVKATAIHVL